jgi:GntR family transcriptional repressor for pyruvate dehydrogenase complex
VFTPVRTRRTFEEAVQQIADAIRVGDVAVGDHLPSERTLAARMNISRPTLREAVKVLSEVGVIQVRPGPAGGMFVRSDIIPTNLLEAHSNLRIGEVSGVLEARRVLEPRVAQLAGLYGTEQDFEAMHQTIETQRRDVRNRARFVQLNLRFHLLLARATRNSTIVALMRYLFQQLDIARDMILRGGKHEPQWNIEIHQRTLEAVMSGNPEVIDAAMDEHLSFLERIWEEESGRARLRRPPDFLLPRAERGRRGAGSRRRP